MHYYLARAVYTCMYEYVLIFKWCCLCGGTITMECLVVFGNDYVFLWIEIYTQGVRTQYFRPDLG